MVFARPFLNAHHDVAVHLKKTPIRIPREPSVVGFLRDDLNHFVVHPEVQNRVHHSRHGIARARAHRNKQRPLLVAKFFVRRFFDFGHCRGDFCFQLRRVRAVVIVKITAHLGRERESWRHRQTYARHLVEVRAFATQQRFHGPGSISVAIAEVVNVTRRACFLSAGSFTRLKSRWLPRALESFSKIRFSFRGHKFRSGGSCGNDESPN